MHDNGRVDLGNGNPLARRGVSLEPKSSPKASSRNITRGVWELARLHTREAWLCWYPAGVYDLFRHEFLDCHDAISAVLISISLGGLFIGRNTERDIGLGDILPNTFRHME